MMKIFGSPLRLFFIAFAITAIGAHGAPQEETAGIDHQLEEAYFSTIASGHLEAIRKAPGVVSVITAADIEKLGATHLDEVLETVTGLHVNRSDLSRLDPVYSIRGIQNGFSSQVLFLFNGIELKHAFSGGIPTVFRLPLNAIDRVEIIKGASSALYGANAYSGVINIIPKRANNSLQPIAQVRTGSFGSKDFTLQHHHLDASGTGYFFSLEHQRSDGDSSRNISSDLQSINDFALGTTASLTPGPLNTHYSVTNLIFNIENDAWSWNNWFWQNADAGNGQGPARALDNKGKENTRSFMTHLQYRRLLDHNFSMEMNASHHFLDIKSELSLFPGNSLIPIGNDGNPYTTPGNLVLFPEGVIGIPSGKIYKNYFDLSLQYMGAIDHIWRFQLGGQTTHLTSKESKNYGPGVLTGTETIVGGSLTDVSGTPDSYIEDQDRQNFFFAVQDQWQLHPNWTLTAGGRFDHYSDFGSVFNPRVGLVWEPSRIFTGKLLYGEAFRAPSFSELYLKNNPSALGNSSLKPEQIKTYELVADVRPTQKLQITNTLYLYKAEDLISNQLSGSVFTFQNSSRQKGYGLELESYWQATDRLNVTARYNYQKNKNTDNGNSIADVPKHTAFLAIDYQLTQNCTLHLNNHWIGSSKRAITDSRPNLKGYAWANLKLAKDFDQSGFSAALIVKNLMDSDAYSPSSIIIPGDYPLEERSIWGELTYRF